MFWYLTENLGRFWHTFFELLVLYAVQLCTCLGFQVLYLVVTSKSCVDKMHFWRIKILNLLPFVSCYSCVSLSIVFSCFLYCSLVMLCCHFNVIFYMAIKEGVLAYHKTRFNQPFFSLKNVLYQVWNMVIVIL